MKNWKKIWPTLVKRSDPWYKGLVLILKIFICCLKSKYKLRLNNIGKT